MVASPLVGLSSDNLTNGFPHEAPQARGVEARPASTEGAPAAAGMDGTGQLQRLVRRRAVCAARRRRRRRADVRVSRSHCLFVWAAKVGAQVTRQVPMKYRDDERSPIDNLDMDETGAHERPAPRSGKARRRAEVWAVHMLGAGPGQEADARGNPKGLQSQHIRHHWSRTRPAPLQRRVGRPVEKQSSPRASGETRGGPGGACWAGPRAPEDP